MTRTCKYEACGKHLPVTARADAEFCDELCRSRYKNERRKQEASATRVDRQESGEGSRGGNVRTLDEARELQAQQKAKRDWAGAIDVQIERTLVETGYFHADDLDPLGVPSKHCNLKGTRTASFSNRRLMEKSGTERKVSHAAANGRKAPIYRITKKGREKLVGVGAGNHIDPGPSGGRSVGPDMEPASVDSGETSGTGVPSSKEAGGASTSVLVCADTGAPDSETPGVDPPPASGVSLEPSRARSSMEEQRTSKPTVAGSSPAGRSQQQRGVTRRSTNEHARSEANPATARIDLGTGQEGEPGGKSEVPAAAAEPLQLDIPRSPNYVDPDQRAA